MKFDIVNALENLRPDSEWILRGDSYADLEWKDEKNDPPTLEQIRIELERLEHEWKQNEYKRLRKKAYPSIEDQLDMIYHYGETGWKQAIEDVKNQYPKP